MIKNVLFCTTLSCVSLIQHIYASDTRDEQDQAIGNNVSLPPVIINDDSKNDVVITKPIYEIIVNNIGIMINDLGCQAPIDNPKKFSFFIKNKDHGNFYFELDTTSKPFIFRTAPGTSIPGDFDPIDEKLNPFEIRCIDYAKKSFLPSKAFFEFQVIPIDQSSGYRISINDIHFSVPYDAVIKELFSIPDLNKHNVQVPFNMQSVPANPNEVELIAPKILSTHLDKFFRFEHINYLRSGEEKDINYDANLQNKIKFTIKVTKL